MRSISNRIPSPPFSLTMVLSILIHIALILFLSLTPWPTPLKAIPKTYLVAWVPPPPPEPEIQKAAISPKREEAPKSFEKIKNVEKPKKNDIVEKIKKKEKKEESLHHLHESLEEIRKKAALEEIQKKVAKREVPSPIPSPTPPPLPSTTPPPSPLPPPSSYPPSPPLPSPPPPVVSPSLLEAKLNEYYSLIWAKIKESWTIPELLLKERIDLETIIVVIIDQNGKIQKSWFEKRSGNALYDQMAMRAIKKSEPFPPFPKEWKESTLEVGIRFYPE